MHRADDDANDDKTMTLKKFQIRLCSNFAGTQALTTFFSSPGHVGHHIYLLLHVFEARRGGLEAGLIVAQREPSFRYLHIVLLRNYVKTLT